METVFCFMPDHHGFIFHRINYFLVVGNCSRLCVNFYVGVHIKHTCYNSKRNLVPYSKGSPLALMHLWHLSTITSFLKEYFAERL